MIARGMQLIDIDPAGWGNYLRMTDSLSPSSPRVVLWHDEGMALRMTLDGQLQNLGVQSVQDARASASSLYARLGGRARQVVVTDRSSYNRLSDTLNLPPRPGELKYDYQARLNQAVNELSGEAFAIFPELSLDRGPLSYRRISEFITEAGMEPVNVVLGVFERGRPYFSFVARMNNGFAEQVTSFDHWPEMNTLEYSAEGLDSVVQTVEISDGPVASALFIERVDLERLFDGERHDSLPGSLIVGGRAFGISNMPGVAERAFLAVAGLFAYVPLFLS